MIGYLKERETIETLDGLFEQIKTKREETTTIRRQSRQKKETKVDSFDWLQSQAERDFDDTQVYIGDEAFMIARRKDQRRRMDPSVVFEMTSQASTPEDAYAILSQRRLMPLVPEKSITSYTF